VSVFALGGCVDDEPGRQGSLVAQHHLAATAFLTWLAEGGQAGAELGIGRRFTRSPRGGVGQALVRGIRRTCRASETVRLSAPARP
jgi:hypothetical protein